MTDLGVIVPITQHSFKTEKAINQSIKDGRLLSFVYAGSVPGEAFWLYFCY